MMDSSNEFQITMHLIVYGPEGSGKGTQAALLAKKFRLPVYTSGDLVREAAQKDSGLIGEACRRALQSGTYVGDSEMFVLWKNKLRDKESKKGFILDGFPRNLRQSRFLMRKVEKYGYDIDQFIYLSLTDKESTKRLLARHRPLVEGSSESHDTPDRIAHRLATFRKQEKEILDFFRDKNLLLEVHAAQPVNTVFEGVVKGLKG